MKKRGFILLLVSFLSVTLHAQTLTEEQKISGLITYIRNLDNAVFIRNGTEYSAETAANHFQSKMKKAGKRIKTARQFIQFVASKSSSGEAYKIRFSNGVVLTTADALGRELNRLETCVK